MGRFAGDSRRRHPFSTATSERTAMRTHLYRVPNSEHQWGEWKSGEQYCSYVTISRHVDFPVHRVSDTKALVLVAAIVDALVSGESGRRERRFSHHGLVGNYRRGEHNILFVLPSCTSFSGTSCSSYRVLDICRVVLL